LCGEIGCRGPRCGCDISFTLILNHEEEKFPSPRDDLPALIGKDQGNNTRWDFLGYPVQSNNKTTRPRMIYNMAFT
jgi:hypothetical protein